MDVTKLKVEVAYAKKDTQCVVKVIVEKGATVQDVINESKVLVLYPEIDFNVLKVGIFGKIKTLTDLVKAGDRIEIYRPLVMDPKEARRKRAVSP